MRKPKEIKIGDKYGNYEVITDVFYKGKYRFVKCQCKCGKIKDCPTGNINRLKECRICSSKKYHKFKPGDKIEDIEVIGYIRKNNKCRLLVKCKCGTVYDIIPSTFGKTKTCGCINNIYGKNHHSFTGYEDISGSYYSGILHHSKLKNREFSITIEEIWELFLRQNRKCALSGIDISFQKNNQTASLDRIDSKKGYTIDNIQWVHKDVNRMKTDLDLGYFIELCRNITNFKGLNE